PAPGLAPALATKALSRSSILPTPNSDWPPSSPRMKKVERKLNYINELFRNPNRLTPVDSCINTQGRPALKLNMRKDARGGSTLVFRRARGRDHAPADETSAGRGGRRLPGAAFLQSYAHDPHPARSGAA